MAAFQIPPLVIFSLAESGIAKPADLAGRRVGVTTDYWKGVLDETLKAAGVDPSTVKTVKVDAEDLQALYDHRVDAWLGYAQDEPIQAEMAGHPVRTIFPADYGVGGYEGLVLVNDSTIKADPQLVRRFVRASQQGWRYAVEHPDEAAQILLKWAPQPGLAFQKLAVRAVGPLVDTPQAAIGWIDEAAVAPAHGCRLRPRPPGLHDELTPRRSPDRGLGRAPCARPSTSGRPSSCASGSPGHGRSGTDFSSTACSSWRSRRSPSASSPRSSCPATRTTVWSASCKSVATLKQQEVESWVGGLRLNLDIVLSAEEISADLHTLTRGRADLAACEAAHARVLRRFTWAANRMGLFEELFFMGPSGPGPAVDGERPRASSSSG